MTAGTSADATTRKRWGERCVPDWGESVACRTGESRCSGGQKERRCGAGEIHALGSRRGGVPGTGETAFRRQTGVALRDGESGALPGWESWRAPGPKERRDGIEKGGAPALGDGAAALGRAVR